MNAINRPHMPYARLRNECADTPMQMQPAAPRTLQLGEMQASNVTILLVALVLFVISML